MSKLTFETVMRDIAEDPLSKGLSARMSPEEKTKVDGIVAHFVKNFIMPVEELVEKAMEDPEVMREIREILSSGEATKKKDEGK